MRIKAFSSRGLKEIIRDPMSLIFGLCFPLVLLFLMSAIQSHIPVDLFEVSKLAPGIAVFGLSFLSLFTGALVAKDRTTAFLTRLFASPMKPAEYIVGYILPLLPVAIAQSIICLGASLIVGLDFSINILVCIAALIPSALLFIACGLLFGCCFSDKAVGGISSILVNAAAWLSGIWFDTSLVGGVFEKITNILPFVHCVDSAKAAIAGDFSAIFPHSLVVLSYALVIFIIAIMRFSKIMKSL